MTSRLSGLLAAVLAAAVPPCAAQGPRVWAENALVSVRREGPASGRSEVRLEAARNEWADFQVVVVAPPGGALSDVRVRAGALSGPVVIPRASIRLYRAQYVPLSVRGAPARPDALIPEDVPGGVYESFPFSVPAGANQPVYVEIHVPKDAPAGAYRGTVTVSSPGQGPSSIGVTLTVWDFALPDRPALASDLQSYDRWLWLAAGEAGAPHEELMRAAWAALIENRLGGAGQPEAWMGAREDRQAASSWLAREHPLCAPAMSSASDFESFAAYVSSARARDDVYARTGDEPSSRADYRLIGKETAFWRRLGIRTMVTISGRTAWSAFDADIWVVHHALLADSERLALIRARQAKGRQVWSYDCCEAGKGTPHWSLASDPVDFRITPWLDFGSGFPGLLYWTTTYWKGGPAAVWTNALGRDGDGILFYPGSQVGAPGRVVPSARLKALRDGVQDYDYLALLSALGGRERARAIAAELAPAWDRWSRDPEKFEAARERAASEILRLSRSR